MMNKQAYVVPFIHMTTLTCLVYICYASICSLYYAVEPYDEAFYLSEAYHLVLGGKLFIDFYSIAQLAGLFTYPFLKLFLYIKGNTDGLFLFSRYLYFVVCFFCLIGISSLLRFKFTYPIALLISSVCVLFVPFNIHGLSYNTLAMLFLTCSLFAGFYAVAQCQADKRIYVCGLTKCYWMLFLAGVFLFFTLMVYPTLGLLLPVTVSSVIFYIKPNRRKSAFFAYIMGMALGSLGLLLLFVRAGINQLQTDFQLFLSLGVQGGGLNKFEHILLTCWSQLPHAKLVIFSLCMIIMASFTPYQRIRDLARLVIILCVLFLIRSNEGLFYMRYLALLSPFVYLTVRDDPHAHVLFYMVTIPSLLAGCITSWSSSNGVINSVIGFFPATITTCCYLMMLGYSYTKPMRYGVIYLLIGLMVLLYPLKRSNELYNYADLPSAQLTARVSKGVFSGIYTTPEKKEYYENLQSDLRTYVTQEDSILFFDDFPLGYLMVDSMPMTNTTWIVSSSMYPHYNRQSFIDYFYKERAFPDMIVRILHVPMVAAVEPYPYPYRYSKRDPLFKLFGFYQLVYGNNHYEFYKLI